MTAKYVVEVVGDTKELQRLDKKVRRALRRVVKDTVQQGAIITQQLVPVRSGKLQQSITSRVSRDGLEGSYGTKVFYAKFLDQGTKGPYVIRAKKAGALAFKIGNRTIIRKSVVHPGIKPMHFMDKSAQRIAPSFAANVNRAIDEELG